MYTPTITYELVDKLLKLLKVDSTLKGYTLRLEDDLQRKVVFKFWKALKLPVFEPIKRNSIEHHSKAIMVDIRRMTQDKNRNLIYCPHIRYFLWHLLFSNTTRWDKGHRYDEFRKTIQKSKRLNEIYTKIEEKVMSQK